jgi:Methylmalonyl Co-A mutase-associated GTPase MeaB
VVQLRSWQLEEQKELQVAYESALLGLQVSALQLNKLCECAVLGTGFAYCCLHAISIACNATINLSSNETESSHCHCTAFCAGAGKSTFIEALGLALLQPPHNHRVAVITVDPSSLRSGGSILGDKTRMDELARSPQAFIRGCPSRGVLGGIAQYTNDVVSLSGCTLALQSLFNVA